MSISLTAANLMINRSGVGGVVRRRVAVSIRVAAASMAAAAVSHIVG